MNSVIAYIRACNVDSAFPLQSIKSIAHRPSAYWAIRAALLSPNISKVYFTADSDHIKRVISANIGDIATDKLIIESDTTSCRAGAFLEFCKKHSEATHICRINADSVLLQPEILEEAIAIINKTGVDSVIGVVKQARGLFKAQDDGLLNSALDEQTDKENIFQNADAFFISEREAIITDKKNISGRTSFIELPPDFMLSLNNNLHFAAIEKILLAHHPEIAPRRESKPVKMVITGVDGVLTDGSIRYDINGAEIKRFSTYDGVAFNILREKGYKTAIISSHNNPITQKYAENLGINYIFQGINDKLAIAEEICKNEGLDFSDIVFIGDDINDIELLKAAGIAACPDNAVGAVKAVPNIIHLTAKGGSGVLRSMLKYIFGTVLPEEVTISRNHLHVHRPWGAFEVIASDNGYKAKKILVRTGEKLSLQMHHHRNEHWIVVQGIAYVTLGGVEKEYHVGEHIYIPLGTTHRLENRGNITLEVLEVSLGNYLGEDDIVRLEDIYGRT